MSIEPLEQRCIQVLSQHPDKMAVDFQGQIYTWSDMRRVAQGVGDVIDNCGAGPVPQVAFVARNRPSALAAFLGLLAKRCNIRMVYPFQSSESLAHELERIQPQVVVAAAEDFTDVVCAALHNTGAAAATLTDMHASALPGFEQSVSESDPALEPQVILLTSGTTGTPKPFALSYETVGTYYTSVPGAGSGQESMQPTLLYFPVSNISGLYATLPPLINAAPIVLLDRFNLDAWLDFVKKYQPHAFGLPPAGYKMVLDAGIAREDLASIDIMGAGAAPLDPAVQAEFEERYGIPILLSYGATEFGGPVTRMTPELWREFGKSKLGSVGKPFEGMAVRVIDPESGSELPAGEEGLLEVVSCRMGPDWIRTSDLGVIDSDGFLFLRGRVDGAIIRGGFKLLPSTIEAGLLNNPQVAMASVVAIPDPRLGQVPAAAVVLKEPAAGVSVADLEADLRRHVPATYIPATWKIVSVLPRTPSMKVDVPAVKAMFCS